MREKRNAYRILMGEPEGKSPLERPRYSWLANIKDRAVSTGLTWLKIGIIKGLFEHGN
jgi:hypothetical protein